MTIKTVKIKSTDENTQGKFVIVNECDFDSNTQELYSDKPKRETAKEKKARLALVETKQEQENISDEG